MEPAEEKLAPAFEANWDRLTALGGLTPLELLKLLYFLFPFILPIVFVPLLFLSTGLLLLPVLQVTRRIEDDNEKRAAIKAVHVPPWDDTQRTSQA